jgi:hypothetical protein
MHLQLATVARAGIERPYGQASAQASLCLEIKLSRKRDCRDVIGLWCSLSQRLV